MQQNLFSEENSVTVKLSDALFLL